MGGVPSPADVAHRVATVRAMLQALGCQRAILFGSAARGDIHEGSDLDVIVVRRTELPFVERPRELPPEVGGLALLSTQSTNVRFSPK
jgi:hypothetical protein